MNHLVGGGQQLLRDGEAEGFGVLGVASISEAYHLRECLNVARLRNFSRLPKTRLFIGVPQTRFSHLEFFAF